MEEVKEYKDIKLTCLCGKDFLWEAGEQKFMNDLMENGRLDKHDEEGNITEKGTVKPPRRCRECRNAIKIKRNN